MASFTRWFFVALAVVILALLLLDLTAVDERVFGRVDVDVTACTQRHNSNNNNNNRNQTVDDVVVVAGNDVDDDDGDDKLCTRQQLAAGLAGQWVDVPWLTELKAGRSNPYVQVRDQHRVRFSPRSCSLVPFSADLLLGDVSVSAGVSPPAAAANDDDGTRRGVTRRVFNLGSSPAFRLASCFGKRAFSTASNISALAEGLQYASWNTISGADRARVTRVETYCGFFPHHVPFIVEALHRSKPTRWDVLIGGWGEHWQRERHSDRPQFPNRAGWLLFLQLLIDQVFLPFPGLTIYRSQAVTKFASDDGVYEDGLHGTSCRHPSDYKGQYWQLDDWKMLMDKCGSACDKIHLLEMTTPTTSLPLRAYPGRRIVRSENRTDCLHLQPGHQCAWWDFVATMLVNDG